MSSRAVANGADAFVEPVKETRPDFKTLKKIEKERREILLRVSSVGHWFETKWPIMNDKMVVAVLSFVISHATHNLLLFKYYRRNYLSGESSCFGLVLVWEVRLSNNNTSVIFISIALLTSYIPVNFSTKLPYSIDFPYRNCNWLVSINWLLLV